MKSLYLTCSFELPLISSLYFTIVASVIRYPELLELSLRTSREEISISSNFQISDCLS